MTLFPTEGKKWIKDLTQGEKVNILSRLSNWAKRLKKNGEPYLEVELMDKTGRIKAKIWDNVDSFVKIIKDGEIYKITGMITEYKNQKEIKIDAINPANLTENGYSPEDFFESPAFDTEALFSQMMTTLATQVKNPFLVQLLEKFSHQFKKEFSLHYGAQKIHHAYPGGLLQHTFSIIQLAIILADHYKLNKELILIGALFHDIGKIKEFTSLPAVSSTVEGGLIGHVVMSYQIFTDLINQIDGFPPDLAVKIGHLIVSHHGTRENGAPELPKTPEALALHSLDLLDAHIGIMQDLINQSEKKGVFSDYLPFLARRIYLQEDEN